MKAIVVTDFDKAPSYGQFDEPEAGEGEVKVAVSTTTLTPLVRLIAQERHYAGSKQLPFVPENGRSRPPARRKPGLFPLPAEPFWQHG